MTSFQHDCYPGCPDAIHHSVNFAAMAKHSGKNVEIVQEEDGPTLLFPKETKETVVKKERKKRTPKSTGPYTKPKPKTGEVPQDVLDKEGKTFLLFGMCKGVDQFGKLKLNCFIRGDRSYLNEEILTLISNLQNVGKPVNKVGDYYYVNVSLGPLKSSKNFLKTIEDLNGEFMSINFILKTYSNENFGNGVYFQFLELVD